MAGAWNLYVTPYLLLINNEQLQLGIWNLIQRQTINISADFVWNFLYVTTHLHLVPRSRMCRTVPPLPHGAQLKHRDNFTFYSNTRFH